MASDLRSNSLRAAQECSSYTPCVISLKSVEIFCFFLCRVASRRSCRRMQRWGGSRWRFLWSSASFYTFLSDYWAHKCRLQEVFLCLIHISSVCFWSSPIPCFPAASPEGLLSMLGVVVPSVWPWSYSNTWKEFLWGCFMFKHFRNLEKFFCFHYWKLIRNVSDIHSYI